MERTSLAGIEGAHFVLCDAKKLPVSKGWQKGEGPSSSEIRAHEQKGLPIGVIPASIDAVVVDVDVGEPGQDVGGGSKAVAEVLGQTPWASIETPSGGVHHYFEFRGYYGNKKWRVNGFAGDIRCARGFAIIWDKAAFLAGYPRRGGGAVSKAAIDVLCNPPATQLTAMLQTGDRNNQLNSEVFQATKAGKPIDGAIEKARAAGLPDAEIERTVSSATAAGDNPILEAVNRLAALSGAEYDGVRKAEAIRLKVRLKTLDSAVAASRPSTDDSSGQGHTLEWPEPDDWPSPVDGEGLLSELAETIGRYVDMPKPLADTVALWIVSSWLHDRLDISPFLNVSSATKRCGKSLLLEIIHEFAYRPLPNSGGISSAALFRVIEMHRPTLLLDEADNIFSEESELRHVVNGSQRRTTARVLRCVGDDHEPRAFDSFCPKVIAGIGALPDTVLDRSLVIRLERRAEGGPIPPLWRDRNRGSVDDGKRQTARWVRDNADDILGERRRITYPPGLHDRARDAWEILFAIAARAGGVWAGERGRVWKACEHVNADVEDDTGRREQLLADLRTVFHDAGDPQKLSTTVILTALSDMEGRPWAEWKHGKPLSPRGLADLLRPFKIRPKTVRTSSDRGKGYRREDLEAVWKAYAQSQAAPVSADEPPSQADEPLSPDEQANLLFAAAKERERQEKLF